jgi:hypothetical protein
MWGTAPKWVQVAVLVVIGVLLLGLAMTWFIGASKHDNEERPEDKS